MGETASYNSAWATSAYGTESVPERVGCQTRLLLCLHVSSTRESSQWSENSPLKRSQACLMESITHLCRPRDPPEWWSFVYGVWGAARHVHIEGFGAVQCSSIQFSSGKDGICALGEAHMCCTSSLIGFPNVAFKTVPMFVSLTMALSRPFKDLSLKEKKKRKKKRKKKKKGRGV